MHTPVIHRYPSLCQMTRKLFSRKEGVGGILDQSSDSGSIPPILEKRFKSKVSESERLGLARNFRIQPSMRVKLRTLLGADSGTMHLARDYRVRTSNQRRESRIMALPGFPKKICSSTDIQLTIPLGISQLSQLLHTQAHGSMVYVGTRRCRKSGRRLYVLLRRGRNYETCQRLGHRLPLPSDLHLVAQVFIRTLRPWLICTFSV
ncbi:hypothetical protein BKA56DRAFT_244554 [Ilyonectria sp. MPI-CAGE-AT-0026]|nr:hypothetical protein BKA56DRAFT_244554 [Ilyonectria sp. MPI-CAGE-AT-0026]